MTGRPIVFQAEDKPTPHARRMLAVQNKGYKPRERAPNEALPDRIDRMAGHYDPPPPAPIRAGADQHQAIKSKGIKC